METIIEWIKFFLDNFVAFWKAAFFTVLTPIFQLLKSVFFWIVDKIFDFAELAIDAIDFKNELFDTSLAWTALPKQVIYILNECGLDNAILIVVAAMGIRLPSQSHTFLGYTSVNMFTFDIYKALRLISLMRRLQYYGRRVSKINYSRFLK